MHGDTAAGDSSIKRLAEGASQLGEARRGPFQQRSSGRGDESQARTGLWFDCFHVATVRATRQAIVQTALAGSACTQSVGTGDASNGGIVRRRPLRGVVLSTLR